MNSEGARRGEENAADILDRRARRKWEKEDGEEEEVKERDSDDDQGKRKK